MPTGYHHIHFLFLFLVRHPQTFCLPRAGRQDGRAYPKTSPSTEKALTQLGKPVRHLLLNGVTPLQKGQDTPPWEEDFSSIIFLNKVTCKIKYVVFNDTDEMM